MDACGSPMDTRLPAPPDHWLPGFNFIVEEWFEGDRYETGSRSRQRTPDRKRNVQSIPVFEAKFPQDVVHVKLHRTLAQPQLKRNFLIGQAATDERRNLMLTGRQATGRQATSVHLERFPHFAGRQHRRRWIVSKAHPPRGCQLTIVKEPICRTLAPGPRPVRGRGRRETCRSVYYPEQDARVVKRQLEATGEIRRRQ